ALEAIDVGAEDVDPYNEGDEELTLYTDPASLDNVRSALESKKLKVVRAESTLVPKTKIDLAEKEAMQTLRLIDRLEDLDDVQNVYTNAEIADEIAEKYAG
ncbi:MAG: YebC/PmpR family DNA-binding transcriptional regulator, partial [Chloroflexi bacterium]